MNTIRDAIDAWANENIRNASVMTRNTEAYNHMVQAVETLKEQGWAQLEIGKDMPKPAAAAPATPSTPAST